MTPVRRVVCALGVSLLVAAGVLAQSPVGTRDAQESNDDATTAERAVAPVSTVDAAHGDLNAYEAVHQGNERLKSGDPSAALALYNHAEEQAPDAREIAYARGLSHYALNEFEAAREAFQMASLGSDDALSGDAVYGEGTTFHAEALAATDDPQVALSKLENAMRRYHMVLSDRPEHAAARDANFKAASVWRQLKQQVEQQPQDCDNPGDEESEDSDDNEKKKKQSSDGEPQQQDPSEQSESEESQQQEQHQSEQEQESQDQQQASSDNQQADEQQEQEASAAEQQEQQASKEQAERKLREMVQAQRQLRKNRRQRARLVPVKPVDKDW